MWDRIEINVGEVRPNSTINATFHFSGDISNLITKPSCGCATDRWDSDKQMLYVKVHVGAIPQHLKQQGHWALFKTISTSFTTAGNNHAQQLIIKALVK